MSVEHEVHNEAEGRIADERRADVALSALLQSCMDEVVLLMLERFDVEYPYSYRGDNYEALRRRWARSLTADCARQLNTGRLDPEWFRGNSGGDMVILYDAMYKPVAITVEWLLFFGRCTAVIIWRHHGDDPETLRMLRDALERFVQRAIRANTMTFLDDIGAYGALSRTWSFVPHPSGDHAADVTGQQRVSEGAEHRPLGTASGKEVELHAMLTARESQIAALVLEGKSNKMIAAELDMGEGTVKNHLSRMYDKLGVASRTELAIKLMG